MKKACENKKIIEDRFEMITVNSKKLNKFEKYKIIYTNNFSIKKDNPNKNIIYGLSLYVVCNNRLIEKNNRKESINYFFKDFYRLGKNLFNLMEKRDFKPNYLMNDYDIISHYVADHYGDITLNKEAQIIVSNIEDIREYILINKNNYETYSIFNIANETLDLVHKIEDYIFICNLRIKNDITDDLYDLYKLIEYLPDDLYKKNYTKTKKYKELKKLEEKFENLINDKKIVINIRKDILPNFGRDINKIKKIDYDINNNEPPFNVIFPYKNKTKVYYNLVQWFKKYGIPYIITDEYEKYEDHINEEVEPYIEGDELVLPCEQLIVCSIYCYLFYEIKTNWHNASDGIKKMSNYMYGSSEINKKKNVNNLKNETKYSIISFCRLFDTYKRKNITEEYRKYTDYSFIQNEDNMKKILGCRYDKNNTKKINTDNAFKVLEVYSEEKPFQNLCIAALKLCDILTNNLSPQKNEKICPVCQKQFKANSKNKKYCSENCFIKARRKQYRDSKKK